MCSYLKVARQFLSKANDAKSRGLMFDMTLPKFKRVVTAKRCYYTGLPLTDATRSIDRVDSHIGYIDSNVVPCHTTFNSLKGMIENDSNELTFRTVLKGLLKHKETENV